MDSAPVRLKVANVLLDARFGGPQSRVMQVAQRLQDQGIETLVVIPRRDSDYFYGMLQERDVPARRLKLHRLTPQRQGLIAWLVHFWPEVLALRRCFKEEGVKLVHCNNPAQVQGVIAGRLAGAKVVWHLNNSWTPWPVKLLFRLLVPLAHGIIVTGKRVADYYVAGTSLERKPLAEVQSPVDTARFDPDRVEGDARIAGMPGLKIGTVCVIAPGKGLEHFIDMARTLSRQQKDLQFVIVGPPLENHQDYYQGLHRQVADYGLGNITFLGRSDQVEEALKSLDIFVCPSDMESGPNVVWEAMAMARPIVSTDVGDVGRYISDGTNGFVVPAGDSSAMADRVARLIDQEDLRISFGRCVREVAVRELDLSIAASKTGRFYLQIAGMAADIQPSLAGARASTGSPD